MRKLTTDEIWDYTKRMWKWVAFQKEVLKDKRGVSVLKKVWLNENAPEFKRVVAGCFFCQASPTHCNNCPGMTVDDDFDCCAEKHNFEHEPGAFYREILRLDAIRTAEPVVVEPPVVEHEWVHGDVFSTCVSGKLWIYFIPCRDKEPIVVELTHGGGGGTVACQTRDAIYLFNIKDKL